MDLTPDALCRLFAHDGIPTVDTKLVLQVIQLHKMAHKRGADCANYRTHLSDSLHRVLAVFTADAAQCVERGEIGLWDPVSLVDFKPFAQSKSLLVRKVQVVPVDADVRARGCRGNPTLLTPRTLPSVSPLPRKRKSSSCSSTNGAPRR